MPPTRRVGGSFPFRGNHASHHKTVTPVMFDHVLCVFCEQATSRLAGEQDQTEDTSGVAVIPVNAVCVVEWHGALFAVALCHDTASTLAVCLVLRANADAHWSQPLFACFGLRR